MQELISHPFRLTPSGRVATVEQGSDAAAAEQLAVLLMTRPLERPLAPGFGVTDPAFQKLAASEVAAAVETYGPAVELHAIDIVATSDSDQRVVVTYS